MTCPDWPAIVAARDTEPAVDLPVWAEARRHAAACSLCRGEALAADPLLLFASLPERAAAPGEIVDMQAAVSALVRASRVGQGDQALPASQPAVANGPGERPGVRWTTRVAAALGVCSLLALSGAPRPHSPVFGTLAAGGAPAHLGAAVEDDAELDSAVEELDRPGARIYELRQTNMAVVMIVDASLDV